MLGSFSAYKRSLGIEQLAVVSNPSATSDRPDQHAAQVGKYVSKGIFVTISQGNEQGSSNFIVEIDLGRGFVFQMERQQEEEQGKFTLKWVKNY